MSDHMIIYFTGTGNSKFVADALAYRLGDETVSMNALLKAGTPGRFASERPYVIVCPIFAWRIPRFVESFIRDSEFSGNRKMYLVVTMGSETGKAEEYARRMFEGSEMEFMGLTGIAMTDNYLVWSDMPDADTVRSTNERALSDAMAVADRIEKGEKVSADDHTRFSGMKSGFINNMFSKHMDTPKFVVSDACISCGKCAEFCPANNIVLTEGRPVFQGRCFSCLGCIHRCPKAAIDIGKKTQTRGRFVCPEFRSEE